MTRDQRGVARPQDGDGNDTAVVDVGSIELTGPNNLQTPDDPDLVAADDSGVSDADNITRIRSLRFMVTNILDGASVDLFRDSTIITTVTAEGNTVLLTDPDAPENGTFLYHVRQRSGGATSPYSSLMVTVDTMSPEISIEQADDQVDPARNQPIRFSASVSEPDIGLDGQDFSFFGSIANTENAIVEVDSSRPSFQVRVSAISGNGPVLLSVPAGAFEDIAGNLNAASISNDNSITVDTTPVSHLDSPRDDPSFVSGQTFDDEVLDMAAQPDDKLVIVGKFNGPIGTPFRKIVRLGPGGNLDPTFRPGTGANGDIYSVKVSTDGRILIGGAFTSFNGIPAKHIARLFPNGTLDRSFDTSAGANGDVNAVGVQVDGSIIAGGEFTTYGGVQVPRLIRLRSDGSLDQSFSAAGSLQPGAFFFQIEPISDGGIVAAGNLVSVTGRTGIVKLLADGSIDPGFSSPLTSGSVQSFARVGGNLLVAGAFSTAGHNGIARLNANGSIDHFVQCS